MSDFDSDVVDPVRIDNLNQENRTFAPTPEFARQAFAQPGIYDEADQDRLAFWDKPITKQ